MQKLKFCLKYGYSKNCVFSNIFEKALKNLRNIFTYLDESTVLISKTPYYHFGAIYQIKGSLLKCKLYHASIELGVT